MTSAHYSGCNPSQWIYQQPRKLKNGGTAINIQSSSSSLAAPRMQLDRLRCPFGVQDGLEVSSRQNLEVAISSEQLREWARSIDEQNINWIVANSVALFKKEMRRETLENNYRTLLTSPANVAYDPLLRLKINKEGFGATNVMVVVQEGTAETPLKWKHGSLADIERNSEVIPIVEISGLWFVSKSCGMTLLATDLLVFPKRRRGFDFQISFAAGAVQYTGDEEDAAPPRNMPEPSVAPTRPSQTTTNDNHDPYDDGNDNNAGSGIFD